MKYFIAAHDFHAEEEVELSVDKGEVLCATEDVCQDGWMKVEVITDARRRGFVPMSYLNELTAAEAMALLEAIEGEESQPHPHAANEDASSSSSGAQQATSSPAQTSPKPDREISAMVGVRATTPTPTTSTSFDVQHRSTDAAGKAQPSPSPRQAARSPDDPRQLSSSVSPAPNAARTPALTTTSTSGAPLTPAQQAAGPVSRHLIENPNAAIDAFMKNEVYFKQLMQRRASALAQMQAGIEEAMTEVAACKDRNVVLTRKLRELDEVVERERTRWVNRVEEEKAHVSRTAPYSAAMAVPVSSGTTPVRSPISGRQGGPGRSVLDDNTPRQLRA